MVPFPQISNIIKCIKELEDIHAINVYFQVIGISVICIWSGFSRLENWVPPVIGWWVQHAAMIIVLPNWVAGCGLCQSMPTALSVTIPM